MEEKSFYFESAIDESGYFVMPASWVEHADLANGVVILPHLPSPTPEYLATDIWPNTEDYEIHLDRVDGLYYSRSKRTKELLRAVYSAITYETVDEQGRIKVPGAVKDLSRLNGKIICAEMIDHLELWNIDVWSARMRLFDNSLTDFLP